MTEWWRQLRGRPFYWALDEAHPPAALYMLRAVVERPDAARPLRAARLALRESPPVAALRAQLGTGAMAWSPRYQTALWALRLLAELGVPGDDEAIAEAADRLLDSELDATDAPVNGNAIVLHSALALGFHQEPRVQQRLQRLRAELAAPPLASDAPPNERAAWLAQAAFALAQLPAEQRDSATLARLGTALAALDPDRLPEWAAYTFPTFDQPDDLTLATSSLRLGLTGEWLRPWVSRLVAAQDAQGLWAMGRALPTPGGVTWGEAEGQPSRWISARALYVLRAFFGE